MRINEIQGYDLIGDIHGHAHELKQLLSELGYQREQGVWRHPYRKAVFLGDLIDRGPQQREVIRVVRPMVDQGTALICLGNHELNAIAYATPNHDQSGYLRPHKANNYLQHEAFLVEYPPNSEDLHDLIAWFRSLPLWLELELHGHSARVIHACWHQEKMNEIIPYLKQNHQGAYILGDHFDHTFFKQGSDLFEALEILLKGPEIKLPLGTEFVDKGGVVRKNSRIRWWQEAKTWGEAVITGGAVVSGLNFDQALDDQASPYYCYCEDIPVFIGHYWMNGHLSCLTDQVACLDWSVAKGGRLVAYRWDGEQVLDHHKFVAVWSR